MFQHDLGENTQFPIRTHRSQADSQGHYALFLLLGVGEANLYASTLVWTPCGVGGT